MPRHALLLSVLVCGFPYQAFARQPSQVYFVEIRGTETVKEELLARLEARTCFEEADLQAIETYLPSREHGGECHAFRRYRPSSAERHVGHYLLKIELKEPARGRRRFTLRGYILTAKKFELVFNTGGEFTEARFVKEAANEIAVRTFQLQPEPERRPEPFVPEE